MGTRSRLTVSLSFALFALFPPERPNQRKKLRGEDGETDNDKSRKWKVENHAARGN